MTVLVSRNPMYEQLLVLDLPLCDYVVFGSGPMFAHDLLETPSDIDLVARGAAWDRLEEIAATFGMEVEPGHLVLFNGDIEAFTAWEPGEWDVDALIDSGEFIDGVPFVPLHSVLHMEAAHGSPQRFAALQDHRRPFPDHPVGHYTPTLVGVFIQKTSANQRRLGSRRNCAMSR